MARSLLLISVAVLVLTLLADSTWGMNEPDGSVERFQRDITDGVNNILEGVNSQVQAIMKDPTVKKKIVTQNVTKTDGEPAVMSSKTVTT